MEKRRLCGLHTTNPPNVTTLESLDEDLYDRGTATDEITRYAEFVYFHPFIRRFLYGDPQSERAALRIFKRTDVKQM